MRALVVQGLAFGDEGKGVTTDYLVRQHHSPLVVRYNGGPQAAHNVVTPDGVHHTFSQFGSGTLAGARTHLSKFMLVEPMALAREAYVLKSKGVDDPWSLLSVDPEAVVITPYHREANRVRELRRGPGRHGSVGLGVGEARSDELEGLALRVKDLSSSVDMLRTLSEIKNRKERELGATFSVHPEHLEYDYSLLSRDLRQMTLSQAVDRYCDKDSVLVFEGAQGVLLDEHWGFAPYNSWTDCTFQNADYLCGQLTVTHGLRFSDITRVGVIRTYFTRHGNGPFPTYAKHVAEGVEKHNTLHPWMGDFRTGYFDASLLDYAVKVASPNALVVTHNDIPSSVVSGSYKQGPVPIDGSPESRTEFMWKATPQLQPRTLDQPFVDWVYERTHLPVLAAFHGPSSDNCLHARGLQCHQP